MCAFLLGKPTILLFVNNISQECDRHMYHGAQESLRLQPEYRKDKQTLFLVCVNDMRLRHIQGDQEEESRVRRHDDLFISRVVSEYSKWKTKKQEKKVTRIFSCLSHKKKHEKKIVRGVVGLQVFFLGSTPSRLASTSLPFIRPVQEKRDQTNTNPVARGGRARWEKN